MTQVSDNLPEDISGQPFAADVDPTTGLFALPWAMAIQTISGKVFAAKGVLPVWKTDITHNALAITTAGVKRGTAGSGSAAVDARGFNRCTVFINVTAATSTVSIRIYRRFTQTGVDFLQTVVLEGSMANGDYALPFDVDSPYFMVEVVAATGTATATVNLYLHRG
jgi:hypothetical protein